LGIQDANVWQAIAVYFFSLAVGLIIPIPVDIGLIEVGGIGALLAFGVDRSAAVSAMLLFRVLTVAVPMGISLFAMLILRDELRAALRGRKGRGATQPEQPRADDLERAGAA
jgi:uncharacterized membrane protein YbhN (UPF0104 family)